MPLYLYKCPKCSDTQEVDHSMADTPVIECGKCKAECKKVPGVGAVFFKGTGWGSNP